MKNFKKWLAIGLTAAMVTGMSGVSAMAAGGGDIYVMFASNVMSLDTNLATDAIPLKLLQTASMV